MNRTTCPTNNGKHLNTWERARFIAWQHPDGRRIEVYEDRKVRSGYAFQQRFDALGRELPLDEWPVLTRAGSSLPDAEWYAAPNDEWSAAE